MKQSNITYKQTEYFSSGFKKTPADLPSVNGEPTINTKINENPYRQNVEIEKDEIVLQPDLSALHKAGGKKHSQGGTSVYLKPNSFIFSDDKTLAFDKKDYDLFEFKKGGKFKPQDNTPAKVVEKNVDLKHYNRLVNNLSDKNKDEIAKESSQLMLDKYMQTLGNIAYIQEEKKQFPQGMPEFAEGTAPVYNTELKNEIMEQKQYAKYGGKINNPYLPKAQLGIIQGKDYDGPMALPKPVNPLLMWTWKNNPSQLTHKGDKLQTSDPKTGVVSNTWNGSKKYPTLESYADAVGYPVQLPRNPLAIQTWVQKHYPDLVAHHHSAPPPGFGMPNAQNPLDDYLGVRWEHIADDVQKQKTPYAPSVVSTTPRKKVSTPQVPEITGKAQNGIPVDWQFTPWQKLSQAHNAMKWAGAKRYMPYRSRYNATYVDPAPVNPEQAVADIKNAGNVQTSALSTLNPILRNAQAQSVYGQGLGVAASVRSQYDNQNAQILNQARMYNNQVKNNESMVNMGNDQNYYRESIAGRQNFDNMRNFLSDQWMNNVMRDVETNQQLAYNMLTLGPKPAYGYDWKTGNFYRNEKNILDAQADSKSDFYTQFAGRMMDKVNKGEKLTAEEVGFFKALSIGKIPFTPSLKKKGGVHNPYK